MITTGPADGWENENERKSGNVETDWDFVILLLFLGQTVFSFYGEGTAFAAEKELRGIWVSVFDFPKLGLNASSESGFVKMRRNFWIRQRKTA